MIVAGGMRRGMWKAEIGIEIKEDRRGHAEIDVTKSGRQGDEKRGDTYDDLHDNVGHAVLRVVLRERGTKEYDD